MAIRSQTISTGLWRWLQGSGLERFEFSQAGEEWILRGTVLTLSSTASEAEYEIACDAQFRTRRAHIVVRDGAGERTMEILSEKGRWYQNGSEVEGLERAIDIDLGWSPATNTLPIRRLGLKVGESSGEVTAAWVRFPDLALQPLEQEYQRLEDRVYQYSSHGGVFRAKLVVDEHGLVQEYEGFWQRVRA